MNELHTVGGQLKNRVDSYDLDQTLVMKTIT